VIMKSSPQARAAFVQSALAAAAVLGCCRIACADDDEVAVLREVRYRDGSSKSWTLDLAMPKANGEKAHPAVVVIHGGG